jgi:hypothetical protein
MSQKTINPSPNPDQWKRLLEAWPRLHRWQRKILLARAYWLIIPRLRSPVVFSLRATVVMFALMIILPIHPMAIPTAAGGGLAFALITH